MSPIPPVGSPPPATAGAAPGGNADYNPTLNPTAVTFIPGSFIQCVTVNIFPDTTDEPDELFFIFADEVGDKITILNDNSSVIIIDDDGVFNDSSFTVIADS